MPQAKVNGVTLEYDERGDGEPMLLIMGLATQMIAWPQDFVDKLVERGFRVIRFDNRDIGLSSKTEAPTPLRGDVLKGLASARLAKSDYTLADMAADAVGLLDHLGVDKAHLVGVSMGGMISQQLTIDHPHRVLSLTSIMSNTGDRRHGRPRTSFLPVLRRSMTGPFPKTREEAIEVGVQAWRNISGPHFDEADIRALIETALDRDADPIGRVRQLNAISASPDRTEALRQVTVPTLVIHGLVDRLVMPSGGVATARAIHGSRLLMFPDMGHDLPRPRRAEIADAIAVNAGRARVAVTP